MFNGLVSMAERPDEQMGSWGYWAISPFGHRNKSIKHRTTAIGQLTLGPVSSVGNRQVRDRAYSRA